MSSKLNILSTKKIEEAIKESKAELLHTDSITHTAETLFLAINSLKMNQRSLKARVRLLHDKINELEGK